MQDLVSTRWMRVVGLVASLAVVWALFIPYGLPWMGLALVSMAFAAAVWQRMRSNRSIAQMLYDVEGEPARAVAASPRVAASTSKAGS